MAKQEQILVIDPPNELTFFGPFTQAVASVMKLTNPSDKKVCFKIKTTAPKRYCVKPNSGVIDPNQTMQIFVSLQPFDFDPSERNRHKFMVQSMYAPDGEINQDTLWKETDPNQLMDSKLKCVFVMPEQDGMVDSVSSQPQSDKNNVPPSPKSVHDGDVNMKRTFDEIKKLQEEVSALRLENIQLKEKALRQQRLADKRGDDSLSSPSSPGSSDLLSTVITASNPNATALNQAYLYAAVLILVLGIIVGKWIL